MLLRVEVASFHPAVPRALVQKRFHALPYFYETLPPCGGKVRSADHGGLVSVALFLASRRAVISRHPTLWSPDFPLRTVRTIV